jgi:tRNA(Arg) A34 adenosine deaminase TadA
MIISFFSPLLLLCLMCTGLILQSGARHFVVSMAWFQYCYETIADCLERSTQLERLELFHIPLESS